MWRALVAMLLLGVTIVWLPAAIDRANLSYDSSTAALAASNPAGDNGSGDKNNQPGYDAATGTMTDNADATTSNDNGTANTGNDNGSANTGNDNTVANSDNDNVSTGAPPPAPPSAPPDTGGGFHIPNQP